MMKNQYIGIKKQSGYFLIKILKGTRLLASAGWEFVYVFQIPDGRMGWFNSNETYHPDASYVVTATPEGQVERVHIMNTRYYEMTNLLDVKVVKSLGMMI